MDKTDESFGQKLRRRRRQRALTQDGLADKLGVADKTVGKWERDEAEPSPSSMLALQKLGLIDQWPAPNGEEENRPDLRGELSDRVRQTFGCPLSELPARMGDLQNESECVMIAYFRRLPSRQQSSVLDIVSSMTMPAQPRE